MSATPLRIGLIGYFGSGNFGNDASLAAMTEFLYRASPDVKLTCLCISPSGINHDEYADVVTMVPTPSRRLGSRVLNKVLLKLPRFVEVVRYATKHVRKLDMLIVPGTGLLQDYWAKPSQLPITLYIWCLAARLLGKRIGFVSVGAGPSRNPLGRWLLHSSAKLAEYRSYRDEESRNYMVAQGVGTKADLVYADIVLSRGETPIETKPQDDPRPLVVGLGLMTHFGWWGEDDGVYSTYIEKLRQFCIRLLNDGYHVRITIGELMDRVSVDDLLRGIEKVMPGAIGKQIIAEHACSQRDLDRQMRLVDVAVVIRFHNVICALKLGKPVICIGYTEKSDKILAEVGMGKFSLRLEQLDVEFLYQQFQEVVANRAAYEEKIRQALVVIQRRLDDQEAVIIRQFLGGDRSVQRPYESSQHAIGYRAGSA